MDDVLTLLASTLRVSVPLILCALAGVISERSGVIDLGLEGKMLATAFAAAAVGVASGSLLLALMVALAVGVAISMLQGFGCVSHRGDQVVMGMAITMTAAGLTVVLGIAWFGQGGQTPSLPEPVRVDASTFVVLAFALVAAVWWGLYRTRLGLRLRATGENPAMVDAAGVSVLGLRYGALAANGVLASLAGCYLVLVQNPQFIPHMAAGRGYMALAAMIFGKWHPVGALLACLLFGFLDAVSIRLQGATLFGVAVPVQAIQALPYVLTVVLLAGFIGRAVAPKALGAPYIKER
jgi:general nucleoside transport system permease protein